LDITRINVEINKMIEETLKARRDRLWQPFVAGAAVTGGLCALFTAIATILIKLYGH
jgi:hypothetical protein